MSIHTQPDLCLVTIFSDLPLIDLVSIGQVCPRWRQLQPSVTSRVRALTIKVGLNDFHLIEGSNFVIDQLKYLKNDDGTTMAEPLPCETSSFHFRELKSEKVVGLARTFANVSKLVISLNCVDSAQLCLVAELLHLLRATLVTLKIYYRIQNVTKLNCIPQCHSGPFFIAINLLSSLKHLSLDFDCHFAMHPLDESMDPLLETTEIDLPILTQLDQFDFHSKDYSVDVLYESLRRYAQHSARPLRLSHGYGGVDQIPELLQLDDGLCRRITQLNLSGDPLEDTHLNSGCTRLSSLTSLYTEAENVTIPELFTKLAQLTQLIHLQLDVWFPWPQSLDPAENISRLDSIRSLYLSFEMTNHNNLTMLQLPWTLPNLEVIKVYLYHSDRLKCDICEYHDDGGDNHVNLDQLKRCFGQLLAPLAQCPRLHTISEFSALKVVAKNITKQQLEQGTVEFVEVAVEPYLNYLNCQS